MTDLEITKICAEWLGLKVDHISEYEVWITPLQTFDPLHDWNDLMKKVVPKLPEGTSLYIHVPEHNKFELYLGKLIAEGKFPNDLPHAVLDLVVELKVRH